MKAAFYTGTRQPWYVGLGNLAVRLRTRSNISHCELVFEPKDEVDDLMPDGTSRPSPSGALWCASSGATDVVPQWSSRRAGKVGGVRFKRINVHSEDWLLLDLPWANARYAAELFKSMEGALYDWQLILGFLAWAVPEKKGRWACHEIVGLALGLPEPHRFDPASLYAATLWRSKQ